MSIKESYGFGSVRDEAEKRRDESEYQPLQADSKTDDTETGEDRPMTLKDHWRSLRRSIQEKIRAGEEAFEEGGPDRETVEAMREMITPELNRRYKDLVREFNRRGGRSEEHPQREYVDVNSEDLSVDIESWIDDLVTEVEAKSAEPLRPDEIEELRAQCWFLFDALGNVINTRSVEGEVREFFKGQIDAGQDEKLRAKQKAELVAELQDRYPFDQAELGALIDLLHPPEGEQMSLKLLTETLANTWKEYGLGEQKGRLAKISLGYLAAKGMESFAPYFWKDVIQNDEFNVWVFIEYFGLNKISSVVNTFTDIELTRLSNEVRGRINQRIVDSLFFHEFEFTQEKSFGQIYETLEAGKNSTDELLSETVSTLVPGVTGLGLSLAFLTKLNPVLGGIGLAGLPVMYHLSKRQNRKIWPIYEREQVEGEKVSSRLGSIKQGFEEVKTSSESAVIADSMKRQMSDKDGLTAERNVERLKMNLKNVIPFDVSTVIAVLVGGAMQQAEMISGGAILSNVAYTDRMKWSVKEMVGLYFSQFSKYIQDIKRMEKVLGKYDELDLPEGGLERERVPVSELKNMDIAIRGLRYKNILRGIDLDIKEGEFVTLAGASGAGKSTLLRNLVGLYRPDGGEVTVGGVPNHRIKKYGPESIYAAMSYSNQNPQMFAGMTLRENLLPWAREEVSDERIRQVLDELHLSKLADQLDQEPKNLSGGERVRIGLARTLLKGAKIILLDEPTASLDSQSSTEVRKVIAELRAKHPEVTIVCVSHDEKLLAAGDRTVNLDELQK
ncbi:MAG: ABC transporter ATP-binding protein [bacterium]